VLQRLLDGRYAEIRDRTREVPARPEFAPPIELPKVSRLCNEVREQAAPVIDALGIPDSILRAPIGLRDPAPASQ
jgi:hypothetical protein